jgi:phage tail-like protein
MEVYPVKYAVLRYQRDWDGVTLTGLQQQEDGALTLARVPSPPDGQPVSLPPPYDVDPSGIALGRCKDLYLSDTANNAVAFIDETCGARVVLPSCNGSGEALGQFNAPRGLLVGPPGGLYVADSGNARIQVFRLPSLELRAIWDQFLEEPTCLAADSQHRVYVLDRGLKRVLRFNAWGVPDDAYNAATMAQPPALKSPYSLTIGAQDILFVADADNQSNSVLSFDVNGKALGTLPTNASPFPAKPRALAACRDRLYVADAGSGQIWTYDRAAGVYIGAASNFIGPVAAMTVPQDGETLYIKPGPGQDIVKLQTLAAYIPSGTLVTGPLDAGESSEWERAHVKAEIPGGTNVRLFTFVSDKSTMVPGLNDWVLAPALDILVPPLPGIGNCQPGHKRFLWMQAQLNSSNQQAAPVLQQVQAETTGESYLDHLPAVYRKEDLPRRFLERWLALFRSELGDLELLLEDMPRLFDPITIREEDLPWLASWLAFELPEGKTTREKRRLLALAHEIYTRRGTPSGIRRFNELYADAKAHLFEAFRERHVWQLGTTSALGFDTALATSAPNGMIVAGVVPADPKYLGLQGDYYCGPNFEALVMTRSDPTIYFEWGTDLPAPSMRRCRGSVTSVAWNTAVLATGSADQTAKVWDGNGNILLTLSGHSDTVTSVAWSSDGNQLATGSKDQTAKIWDSNGNLLLTAIGHGDAVTSVAWSPNGMHLATGSADRTAKLWDVSTGRELLTFSGHGDAVTSVAWSPNGTQLATGSKDQTAKLWDVGTGLELLTFSGHSDAVTSVAWSPDVSQLATGSKDRTAKAWDVGTGLELLTFSGHSDAVTSVAWSPVFEGGIGFLATGSADQTAKEWDVNTGQEVLTFSGHSDAVTSVAWNAVLVGLLATGSKDATAKMWTVAGKELLTLATPVSFSVRWTGQIQPRYSERYDFHLLAIGGTRLWVNDELIIDTWKNPQSAEAVGGIALTAGRWYSLRLEYNGKVSVSSPEAGVHLSWSSRSQQKQIVPQSRLYSILDETANLDVPAQAPGCGTLLVGQTVVGESGPLQASQFGSPLFSDTAHLFTVSLPAAIVPNLTQRQELRRVIEAEKPAHTDFHLCFVEPLMRVGFQARIGVDTIIAGPSEPMSLTGTLLGLDSVLGGEPEHEQAGRLGKRARLGRDTVLG